jgi:hypothetical protein
MTENLRPSLRGVSSAYMHYDQIELFTRHRWVPSCEKHIPDTVRYCIVEIMLYICTAELRISSEVICRNAVYVCAHSRCEHRLTMCAKLVRQGHG